MIALQPDTGLCSERKPERLRQRPPLAAWVAALVLVIGLTGCAAPPRTKVVLLPDEDGNVGAVSVASASGSQQLDHAFGVATVGGSGNAATNEPTTLQPDALHATYRQLMQAQPSKPKVFVLYFALGKAELTAESKAQLSAVLTTARARKPTEVSVFGHADALGNDQQNVRLSAERAKAVAGLLRASDPSVGTIEIRYFGSKEPLHRPDAQGAQPKNRRVEVMIL